MDTAVSGGAPAPAAPSAAPINTDQGSHSQPLGSQTPVAEKPPAPPAVEAKPEPKKEPEGPSKSAGDAIRRANEAAKAKAAEKAPEPKAEQQKAAEPAKPEQPRGESGKYASPNPPPAEAKPAPAPPAPPQQSTHGDAPARFSNDAKAAWATAPEPIKAEVHRAIRELEQGHQKYKGDSEAFETVRKYHDLAKQSGTTLDAALAKYTGIEDLLSRDPIRGLSEVCSNMGLSLRDVAAHVLNQSPDQNASQQDATIRELRQQVAKLTDQIGGVTKTFEQQREHQTLSQIEAFASDPKHIRFEELADDISFFLTSGRAKDLPEAYQLAERLNPGSAKAATPEPVIPADPPRPPLNPAGQKSISGAPASGSDPASQSAPSSSTREAIKRAMQRAAG